jgi:hypothetical protein
MNAPAALEAPTPAGATLWQVALIPVHEKAGPLARARLFYCVSADNEF